MKRRFLLHRHYIVVTDAQQAQTQVYGIGVLQALPVLNIPLAGGDVVTLDFNAVYQQTFNESRLFPMLVDYAQPPIHQHRYSATDRAALNNIWQVYRHIGTDEDCYGKETILHPL